VVGGLLTSTFLTLIVVPIMYTLLNKDGGPAAEDIDAHLAQSDFAPKSEQRMPALVAAGTGRNGNHHVMAH
jgi:hypothetical protein